MVTGLSLKGSRVTGVDYHRPGRGSKHVDAREVVLCGGAINSPQLLLLSGIGPKADLEQLGIDVVADLPGVGSNLQDHLEVYIQYASKQPVSIGPWLKHRHKPRIGAEWLFLRSGVGVVEPLRGGRLHPQQRPGRLPEPDVPLPPDRDPVRRVAAGRGARLPGAHRADVLRRPRHGDAQVDGPLPAPGAALQLPVDRERPPRVDRDGARRAATSSTSPRSTSSTPASSRRARRWRPTRRSSTGSPRTPRRRCTRRAPPRWAPTRPPCSTRRRCACTASTGCASWTRPPCPTSRTATSTRP